MNDSKKVERIPVQIVSRVEPYLYRNEVADGYLYIDFTHCVMRVKEELLSDTREVRDAEIADLVSKLVVKQSLGLLEVADRLDRKAETLAVHDAPDRH